MSSMILLNLCKKKRNESVCVCVSVLCCVFRKTENRKQKTNVRGEKAMGHRETTEGKRNDMHYMSCECEASCM